MLEKDQLKAMSQVEIKTVAHRELVDIREVEIDPDLPAPLRMQNFGEQVKNPYCFRCGDVTVKIRFLPEGPHLEELLRSYFVDLARFQNAKN